MIKRGCGDRRIAGGAYIEVPTGDDGMPIEFFLVDEPVRIHAIQSGRGFKYFISSDNGPVEMTPRGIRLVTINKITHIFDWVGKQHYPYVWDFIEEARRHGVSRRVEIPNYSSITSDSRLILIHPGAWVEHADELASGIIDKHGRKALRCPNATAQSIATLRGWHGAVMDRPSHDLDELGHHCLGYGLMEYKAEDLSPDNGEQSYSPRIFTDDTRFRVRGPRTIAEIRHQPAIFARFPVSRLVVVADGKDNTHHQKFEKVSRSGVPTEIVEE